MWGIFEVKADDSFKEIHVAPCDEGGVMHLQHESTKECPCHPDILPRRENEDCDIYVHRGGE